MTSTRDLVVDLHTHLWTPSDVADAGNALEFVIENLIAHRELNSIDVSVVSNTLHYAQIQGHGPAEVVRDMRAWHDFAAETHRALPDILFWASAIPAGGRAHLAELDRVVDDEAFCGVVINSSYGDLNADGVDSEDFWAWAADRGLPIYMHPPFHLCGEERFREYRFVSTLGRPQDVARGLARLIVSGTLERHPRLRIVASHLGGSICDLVNRLDYAYDLRAELKGLGDYGDVAISRTPSSYLSQVWLETSAYPSPAINAATETVGADHVVFGSDTPPMMALGTRPIDTINHSRLTADGRRLVLGGNAMELLGLTHLAADESADNA